MRLDRFITLNITRPFRAAFEPRRSTVERVLPVLMYHSISDDPESGVRSYYRVCTSPQRFREQMQWLKDEGYKGVTLSTGLAWLNSHNSSHPDRHVAITFDDGFSDFNTHGFPFLQRHGFSATMYLPTSFISDHGRQFKSRECLTWSVIQELHRFGIEFGSHTVTHPKLMELAWPEIESEVRNSKSEIENHLGVPCPAFAYPYAFPQASRDFVGRFKNLLAACGYESNATTQIGRHRRGEDALQINRLPVNQDDDLPLLTAKLTGTYDWLGRFQSLSKTLRRRQAAAGNNAPVPSARQSVEHSEPREMSKSVNTGI